MNIPLLRFLYRKMWKTRWLTISTLIGLIVAVSFTTSIPMYSDGSLKRVIDKTIQAQNKGLPAGSLEIHYQRVGAADTAFKSYQDANSYIEKKIPQMLPFPKQAYVRNESIRTEQIIPVTSSIDDSVIRKMTVTSLTDVKHHVHIVRGKMFSDQVKNGVIEAVVRQNSLYKNNIHIGDVYKYPIPNGHKPLTVKIVGAYTPTSSSDLYWFQGMDGIDNELVISDSVFQKTVLQDNHIPLDMAYWYYDFNLLNIHTSQLTPVSTALDRININVYQKLKGTRVDISFAKLLKQFRTESLQLQILLFSLAAPVIAMVFFYIVMNSRQALERQRNDIAVLRSRGGSNRQIIWIFLLEGLILGLISLIIGPALGWFMAKTIGSSSGFLSFVDRQSIPVEISKVALLYGLLAVGIAIAASVIPAIVYARSTIVSARKNQARADRKPFWQRWYLDLVLIAISAYGYYLFDQRQMISMQTGMSADQLQVQPTLFFVPALSIFSVGLFFLRVFPWILRIVSWLGRRFLPTSIYLTLTQLSRSAKSYYPLMLLLILTLGLGVYNSSAARTIDTNGNEQIMYKYGADAVIHTVWEGQSSYDSDSSGGSDSSGNGSQNGNGSGSGSGMNGSSSSGGGQNGSGNGNGNGNGSAGGGNGTGNNPGGNDGGSIPQTVTYTEPPFEIFHHLPGVQAAARVLKTTGNVVISGRSIGQGNIMAIDNTDFNKVAWFRKDLYKFAPWQYLNLMGSYAQAAIVPTAFANENHLKVGDVFNIGIEQHSLEFVVVATVPYWPSEYPNVKPFFVVNLPYVYDQVPKIPYEVWLKMKPGAKLSPAVTALQKQNIDISSIDDRSNQLIEQKNLPSRGGVFGILSLGFIVSILITLIGYILYWFFNLSSRVVQFGVLRAMGLKKRQLTLMLLLEQAFTAGLSIVLGFGIGKVVSYLFLPFLQTTGSMQTQVPPFRVVFKFQDSLQLYAVVLVMMLTGIALLFMHIRRLKVHQAIKLGEER